MNWLLPRYENAQTTGAGDAEPRREASPVRADPYRDAPLGVECAWPASAQNETRRTPT